MNVALSGSFLFLGEEFFQLVSGERQAFARELLLLLSVFPGLLSFLDSIAIVLGVGDGFLEVFSKLLSHLFVGSMLLVST